MFLIIAPFRRYHLNNLFRSIGHNLINYNSNRNKKQKQSNTFFKLIRMENFRFYF